MNSLDENKERVINFEELYLALDAASSDLYSFAISVCGGRASEAEALLLDTLFLCLEKMWFVQNDKGKLSHDEYREEFFTSFWLSFQKQAKLFQFEVNRHNIASEHHGRFYQLPLFMRASIFLRAKSKFSEDSISRILGITETEVSANLTRGRDVLLGREFKNKLILEDSF